MCVVSCRRTQAVQFLPDQARLKLNEWWSQDKVNEAVGKTLHRRTFRTVYEVQALLCFQVGGGRGSVLAVLGVRAMP